MRKLLILLMVLCFTFPAEAHEYTEIFETMTDDEYARLCQIVWYESAQAACPPTTDRAVVETVLNRVLSDEFPNTIAKVGVRGQFYFKETPIFSDAVVDAIEFVRENGRTVLPSTEYVYFATKRQSIACNHVWVGGRTANGNPMKGKGMFFGEGRE